MVHLDLVLLDIYQIKNLKYLHNREKNTKFYCDFKNKKNFNVF